MSRKKKVVNFYCVDSIDDVLGFPISNCKNQCDKCREKVIKALCKENK